MVTKKGDRAVTAPCLWNQLPLNMDVAPFLFEARERRFWPKNVRICYCVCHFFLLLTFAIGMFFNCVL